MATPHWATSVATAPFTTPVKKQSVNLKLSATTTPLAGRKTSDYTARVATISTSPKSAKSSPSRGLTLQITDNMAHGHAMSIQSAPVRTVRRLPAPPLLPPPATSIEKGPCATFPYSSLNSACTPRAKRPLPKPPLTLLECSETFNDCENITPPKQQRIFRPLPIPKPRLDDTTSIQAPPRQICKSLPSKPPIIPLSIPSPSVIASFPPIDAPSKRHHHSASAKLSKAAANSPQKLFSSRSYTDLHRVDVVQLHRQLVLNRSPARQSLDSDNTSDDDTLSATVVIQDAPKTYKQMGRSHEAEDEKADHADYTWLLSNRILYHQNKSDGRVTSKWTREKNGKRYTEEDFGNIMQALRSL